MPFYCKAYFLIDLISIEEEHQIVIVEIGLLIMIQVDEGCFYDLVDANLRNFFGLDLALKVCENPLKWLEFCCEHNRVHHFDFTFMALNSFLPFVLLSLFFGQLYSLKGWSDIAVGSLLLTLMLLWQHDRAVCCNRSVVS